MYPALVRNAGLESVNAMASSSHSDSVSDEVRLLVAPFIQESISNSVSEVPTFSVTCIKTAS